MAALPASNQKPPTFFQSWARTKIVPLTAGAGHPTKLATGATQLYDELMFETANVPLGVAVAGGPGTKPALTVMVFALARSWVVPTISSARLAITQEGRKDVAFRRSEGEN